jgi:UPF0271 protein
MLVSARLAGQHGVSLGAHPSYRDREGFGRRERELDYLTLVSDILEQVTSLTVAPAVTGTLVHYVKPHGAL